jgi:hypothetical protein
MHKSDIPKESLQIQKLLNERDHYKDLLWEFNQKNDKYESDIKSMNEESEKLRIVVKEKDALIESLKHDLEQKQLSQHSLDEQNYTEKYKLKMKIDYLTKKCFQLNWKLDKKDFTPDWKPEKEDLNMLADIIEKKQKEYWDTEKNQLQDPTDFLFNVFAQYENMQITIRKLSEQNDRLKQDLIEAKVHWAESEGQREKLVITTDSLRTKLSGSINGSQRSRISESSFADTPEKAEKTMRKDYSMASLTSRYLPNFHFWGSKKE